MQTTWENPILHFQPRRRGLAALAVTALAFVLATFPPHITGQPQNQIVATNETTVFSVVVADSRSLSYQWRFNGANIVGATNDSLILQNVSTNYEGAYDVVLSN